MYSVNISSTEFEKIVRAKVVENQIRNKLGYIYFFEKCILT